MENHARLDLEGMGVMVNEETLPDSSGIYYYLKYIGRQCSLRTFSMSVLYGFDIMYIRSILEIQQGNLRSLYTGFGVSLVNMFVRVALRKAVGDTMPVGKPVSVWNALVRWTMDRIVDLITYPFDTIRRRQVLTDESFLEAASNLIENHHWMSLWDGALYQVRYKAHQGTLLFVRDVLVERHAAEKLARAPKVPDPRFALPEHPVNSTVGAGFPSIVPEVENVPRKYRTS